jgi:putative membrane protein
MVLPVFVAAVFAGLAALVHVYIFVLESLRWTDPATRRVFGTTEETAEITRPLAYNQGFYNLFLAVGTAIGIVLAPGNEDVGVALIAFGTGSMLAAALVLVTSDPTKARAALIQGLLPALALLALLGATLYS